MQVETRPNRDPGCCQAALLSFLGSGIHPQLEELCSLNHAESSIEAKHEDTSGFTKVDFLLQELRPENRGSTAGCRVRGWMKSGARTTTPIKCGGVTNSCQSPIFYGELGRSSS